MARRTSKRASATPRAKAVKTAKKRVPASPAKKAPAKKAPAKKAPAKKAPPKQRAVATKKRQVRPGRTRRSAAVDAYVDQLEGWQREVIERLREVVRESAPEAVECIKWGQPVFEQGGPFAYARPAGSHVTFGFWRGADLDDRAGVLEGSGDRMRHVKLHEADDVDAAVLGVFVRQAVDLSQRHGNPAAIRRV